MANKIQLSPKKILDKEFQVDFKGYSASEVDYYLDIVVSDYNAFADMLNESYQQNEKLEKENKALKERIADLEKENLMQQDNLNAMEENMSSNVDIIKRISKLEKEVYKNKKESI